MKKDLLEKAKSEYLKTLVLDYLKNDGWRDLKLNLEPRGWSLWGLVFRRGLVLTMVSLLFLGSVVGVARAAKPGDKLYPIKVLSDKVFAKVKENYEVQVRERAVEIVKTFKSSESTPAADQENHTRKDNEDKVRGVQSGQGNLTKTLESQDDKLKKESEGNSQTKGNVDNVMDQAEKVKDEIKIPGPIDDLKLPGI